MIKREKEKSIERTQEKEDKFLEMKKRELKENELWLIYSFFLILDY